MEITKPALAGLFDWPVDDLPKLMANKLLKLSQLKVSSEIDAFQGEVPVNATWKDEIPLHVSSTSKVNMLFYEKLVVTFSVKRSHG